MPRKIRVRGLNKYTTPRKTKNTPLELSALQVNPPSNSEDGEECEHYPVCPDKKRCDRYGRIRVKTKFYKRCDAYSPKKGQF